MVRPARVEVASELSPWRATAARLDAESQFRERRLRRTLARTDVIALCVALLATAAVSSAQALTLFALLLFPALIAAAKILGLYDTDGQRIRKTTAEELPRLAQLGALLVLSVWLGDELFLGGPAGKGVTIMLAVVFVSTAVLGRRAARKVIGRELPRERCLFAGNELSYLRLRTIFDRHELRADLVAHVPVQQAMIDRGSELSDEPQSLLEIIARAGAHRLIIGPHSFTNATTFDLIEAAREAGTRVSLLPDMLEVVGSSVDFDDLFGVTLLGVRRHQLSRSSRRLKRALDLAGATLLLIATAPAMAIIALAIGLDSPGPALFGQLRIGRGGKPFRILSSARW